MAGEKTCGLALVGCGTVGSAVAQRLVGDKQLLLRKTGLALDLKYIVDVDFSNARRLALNETLFQSDLSVVLADPEIDIVIELIGGTTVAREVTERILDAGKHVVTANKALMAHHGAQLLARARQKGAAVSFEASCAGGIPIVRALSDGLIANRIDALYGIVNGTCNYILTQMIHKGESYEQALVGAQADGLAEADPTLDVSGLDSAHKLAILSSLAFAQRIDLDLIPVQGIDTLKVLDVSFGLELGYVVKLLAVARRMKEGLSLRVRPVFITREHPLAWVSGPFNAVSVYGHGIGHTMYYGRGAGGSPTASAVLADVISVALGATNARFATLGIWSDRAKPAVQLPIDSIQSRYYLRVVVVDKPGVMAGLARILGDHSISISSVLQKEPPESQQETKAVPVVITTHTATEQNVANALKEIDTLATVTEKSVCISILEEHEEAV